MVFCNNFNNRNRNYYELNNKKRRDHFYKDECQNNNQDSRFYSYTEKSFTNSPYKKMHFAYSEVNGMLGNNFNSNSNHNVSYNKFSRYPYNLMHSAKRTAMNYSVASDLTNKARKKYAYEPEYNYDTNYYSNNYRDYDYKYRSQKNNNEDKYGLNSFFNPEDDKNIFRSRDERNERHDLKKRVKSRYEEDYYDSDDDFEDERNERHDLKKRVKSRYEEDYYDSDNDFEDERNERHDLKKRVKSRYEEDYYDSDDYLNSHENINFLKKKREVKRF